MVMGSFFRKLIFVANTCAIITQIDIHLFIYSFIHLFIHSFIIVVVVKFLFVSGPFVYIFKFFNHKTEEKGLTIITTMERKTLFFFLYCLIFLEHLIFGYLIFYHYPLVHLHLHII